MEKKLRFTKQNTLAVKGIAVIFLLCYHCFSNEARLYGHTVDFWPGQPDRAAERRLSGCLSGICFILSKKLEKCNQKVYFF